MTNRTTNKMPDRKIYNKVSIFIGIIIFAIICSFPFWYNRGKVAKEPNLVLSKTAKEYNYCIEPKEEILKNHMQILDIWRNTSVRDGKKLFINSKGQKFEMSLTNTCLKCHSNKTEFCDRCHDYVSIDPYCWDCHIDNPNKNLDKNTANNKESN